MNEPKDILMQRCLELSLMQNINIARYAFQWKTLSEDAAKADRPNLAEMCASRAKFYGEQAPGEYLRLIETPLSELIQVTDDSLPTRAAG